MACQIFDQTQNNNNQHEYLPTEINKTTDVIEDLTLSLNLWTNININVGVTLLPITV